MKIQSIQSSAYLSKFMGILAILATVLIASLPQAARALPLFARQTGQNCMACHAGGQFPELTPYGRMFKITGYTIGERTSAPISVMGVVSSSTVANTSKSDDPGTDFQKNGQLVVATGSVFLGGKVTDNIGAFVQITNDPNSTGDNGQPLGGQTNADNIDLRWVDRYVTGKRDLVVGVSANNNPSVSDPWNTAAAWMQYVPVPGPTSSRFIDGNAPYHGYGAGGNVAGVTAYAYWNQTIYAEMGGYSTARGLFSFMSAGVPDDQITRLNGVNPYWRLAWNREWGPHSLMVGTAGMISERYDNPQDTSDPATLHKFRDVHIDAQYQYLLDPHSVTGQLVFAHQTHQYPGSLANQPATFSDAAGNPMPLTNAEDTTDTVRAKLTYVYQAKYGGSLGFFNLTGSTNSALQTSGYQAGLPLTLDPNSSRVGGNLSGDPATRGFTYEAFWMPTQYVRVGAQFTAYMTYNGASKNYDGFGRNADDNNSLFLYLWAAY